MIKVIKKIYRLLTWSLLYFFPTDRKKIVFSSFYGRGYGDNLKYIAEELQKTGHNEYKLYWVVNDKKESETLPGYIKPVKKFSLKHIFHMMTAAVWVDNCRKPFELKKKKQLYIQTWHGGGAQKRCEKDVEDKLGKGYVRMAKHDSKFIDLIISESRFMTGLFQHSFWYDGPVYECGYPRYDIILQCDPSVKKKVFDHYNIPYDKSIALYAPTFRASGNLGVYNVDFERFRANLEKKFGKDFVVLVRLHPNIAKKAGEIVYNDNVINATFYPDLQELLVATDVLLGDYSSVNYDFCLKKAPVFRYTTDIKEYMGDRDFYFDFEEYPFPYAKNNDELECVLKSFDQKKYAEDLDRFLCKMGAVVEYGASDKVAEIIEDYLHCRNKKEFFEKNAEKFIYKNLVKNN